MVRPRYSCVSKSTGLSSASPELSMFQRKTVNSLSHMSTSYTDPIPSNQPGKLGHCSAAKACCTQGTSHDLHSPILKAQAKSQRLGSGSVSSWVSQVVLQWSLKPTSEWRNHPRHMKTSARQTQALHGIENRCPGLGPSLVIRPTWPCKPVDARNCHRPLCAAIQTWQLKRFMGQNPGASTRMVP